MTDVEALDRHRLQSNVTRVLSDEWISILSASVTTSRDQVAVSRFTFELRTRSTPVTF